jgi:hypothetical protein
LLDPLEDSRNISKSSSASQHPRSLPPPTFHNLPPFPLGWHDCGGSAVVGETDYQPIEGDETEVLLEHEPRCNCTFRRFPKIHVTILQKLKYHLSADVSYMKDVRTEKA